MSIPNVQRTYRAGEVITDIYTCKDANEFNTAVLHIADVHASDNIAGMKIRSAGETFAAKVDEKDKKFPRSQWKVDKYVQIGMSNGLLMEAISELHKDLGYQIRYRATWMHIQHPDQLQFLKLMNIFENVEEVEKA